MTGRHDAAASDIETGVTFHARRPERSRWRCRGRRRPAAPVSLNLKAQPKEMDVGTVELTTKRYFTKDQARAVAKELGIDFGALGCDLEQFRMGLGVELEHGPRDPETDVSADDPIVIGKIALAGRHR